MARTVEQVLREMLGGQSLTIAHQVAQIEALTEKNQALEAEVKTLKEKQTP